jgi:hypothetical protein
MKTVLTMQNHNVMKNYIKYFCLFLMIMGTSAYAWGADPTATFDFTSSSQWSTWGITAPTTNGTGVDIPAATYSPFSVADVTMAYTDGTSTVTRCWKATSGLQFRIYSGGSITFSVPAGYAIRQVEFNNKSSM